jgi:hypothetical protein
MNQCRLQLIQEPVKCRIRHFTGERKLFKKFMLEVSKMEPPKYIVQPIEDLGMRRVATKFVPKLFSQLPGFSGQARHSAGSPGSLLS